MSRPTPRGLLSNTLATGASTVWIGILTLASLPFLVRTLGAEEYGVWVLLGAVMLQGRGFVSILDLGQQQSSIQRMAAAPDGPEASRRLGATTRLLVLPAIAVAAVLAVVAPALVDLMRVPDTLTHSAVVALRVLAVQLAIELPSIAYQSGLEALRLYERRRLIDAGRVTVFLLGAFALAASGYGIIAIAVWSLATTVGYVVALVAATHRAGLRPAFGGRAAEELRHGLPLMALRISGIGFRQFDRIILAAVVGPLAVAGFDAADKLNLPGLTMLGIATSALIPAAAHGLRTNTERTRSLVLEATRWSALVTLPAAVAGIAAAPAFALLAGLDDRRAITIAAAFLALTTVVATVYASAFEMTIGAGAGRRLVWVSIVTTVANLVLTIVLASRFGIAGSASASFLTTLVAAPIVLRICGATFEHEGRDLARAAFPALAVGLAVAVPCLAATLALRAVPALILIGLIVALTYVAIGWHALRRHPELLERLRSRQPASSTPAREQVASGPGGDPEVAPQ